MRGKLRMERILVIDDDNITLAIVGNILRSAGYAAVTSAWSVAAMAAFQASDYSLVITDFHMPGLSGQQIVEKVKSADPTMPIIVLTAGMDIEETVGLFKRGVNDYIVKPVIPGDLLHRVGAAIEDARLRRDIQRIEEEKRLIEAESEKLVNWRMLYAYKDISQTEQMINLLTRTINASGGYAWLDMLCDLPRQSGGCLELDKDMLDLIIGSATAHRSIIEYLRFISQIPRMKLNIETLSAAAIAAAVGEFARGELSDICREDGRSLAVYPQGPGIEGTVTADLDYLKRICRELVVNASKFSPPACAISLDISRGTTDTITKGRELGQGGAADSLIIAVKNPALRLQALDKGGNRIVGIPYSYSELVFDLYFTIENFHTSHPREEWSDGTGLYVVRKLLGRMGALVATTSGIDYSGDPPRPIVQFAIAFPLKGKA